MIKEYFNASSSCCVLLPLSILKTDSGKVHIHATLQLEFLECFNMVPLLHLEPKYDFGQDVHLSLSCLLATKPRVQPKELVFFNILP